MAKTKNKKKNLNILFQKPKFDKKIHIGRLYLVVYRKFNWFWGERLEEYLGYLTDISIEKRLEFSEYLSPFCNEQISIPEKNIISIQELDKKEDVIKLEVFK